LFCRWHYIQQLHHLQTSEGLKAGNKLSDSHINFYRQKMKVSLAAQTLSQSVADAIDFCRDSLKLPEFKDSEATSKFIRHVDVLFDIMNSRSPFGKGSKSPMRLSNEQQWSEVFKCCEKYISQLKTEDGKLLINSARKTAFIGFLVNMKSFRFLFEQHVKNGPMKYLLTYKFSQDHLELFFCALRSRFGANNNPTARQFQHAYRRLLIHQEIRGMNGNCLIQVNCDCENITYALILTSGVLNLCVNMLEDILDVTQ
jgi:hypothetical protein